MHCITWPIASLKLNDKNKARMAFSSAAKMDFDPEIQEDALFNSALLTYELDYSPFNEAVQALNEYLDKYPNSNEAMRPTTYLVMAYLNAKNYSLALASIDKIRDKNNEIKKAYQKIAYYRGLELFSNGNLQEAADLLTSSTRYGTLIRIVCPEPLLERRGLLQIIGLTRRPSTITAVLLPRPGHQNIMNIHLPFITWGIAISACINILMRPYGLTVSLHQGTASSPKL